MEESDVHLSHVYVFPDIFSCGVKDEEWIAGESPRGSSLLGNPDRFQQMIHIAKSHCPFCFRTFQEGTSMLLCSKGAAHILICISVTVISTKTENNVVGGGFISSHRLQPIFKGIQGRMLMQGPFLLACFTTTRLTFLGKVLPTVG